MVVFVVSIVAVSLRGAGAQADDPGVDGMGEEDGADGEGAEGEGALDGQGGWLWDSGRREDGA